MTNNPIGTIINGPTEPHSTTKELCVGSALASSSGFIQHHLLIKSCPLHFSHHSLAPHPPVGIDVNLSFIRLKPEISPESRDEKMRTGAH